MCLYCIPSNAASVMWEIDIILHKCDLSSQNSFVVYILKWQIRELIFFLIIPLRGAAVIARKAQVYTGWLLAHRNSLLGQFDAPVLSLMILVVKLDLWVTCTCALVSIISFICAIRNCFCCTFPVIVSQNLRCVKGVMDRVFHGYLFCLSSTFFLGKAPCYLLLKVHLWKHNPKVLFAGVFYVYLNF